MSKAAVNATLAIVCMFCTSCLEQRKWLFDYSALTTTLLARTFPSQNRPTPDVFRPNVTVPRSLAWYWWSIGLIL